MTWSAFIMHAPLLALLALAAIIDVHSRRIPNWLTFLIGMSGLLNSFAPAGTVTPVQSVLGLLCGGTLMLALFAIGALGGGDVKLLAGAGAWLGPLMVLELFIATALLGMVIVLIQCAIRGRLRLLLRNSALVAVNLAHAREVGMDHAAGTGLSCRSVDRPLPYAAPVFFAAIGLLMLGGALH